MQINNIKLYNPNSTYLYNAKITKPQKEVNFSGTGVDGNKMRKNLTGITCPCCGIVMLSNKEIQKVLNIANETPSSILIPVLKKYEESMHPVEKEIFKLLENLSKNYPAYTLRELLETQRTKNKILLHKEENLIINKIKDISSTLSSKSQKILNKTLNEAEKLLKNDSYDNVFKRKVFLGKIKSSVYEFPEKATANTIVSIARKLPRAGTSKSAFIVKYTQKKPSTGQERTSQDIVFAILSPSLATIEHVKVRSPLIDNGGGANAMHNYLLECKRDNNLRDSMPLLSFIQNNPEFYGPHLQKYIDTIIEKINKGTLKGFDDYPTEIAKTLKTQSKGKINIDLSKLNKENS